MIAKHEITQPSKAFRLILFMCLIMQLFTSLYFLFFSYTFSFSSILFFLASHFLKFSFSLLRLSISFHFLSPKPPHFIFTCTNVTGEPMNMWYEWIFFGCLSVIPRLGEGKMSSHIYPFFTVTCWFIGEECIVVWDICCPSHIGSLNN